MSTIFGMAGLIPEDYQYWREADRDLIYEAVGQYVNMANETTQRAASLFIEGMTEVYEEKYQLPMTGMMQEKRQDTTSRPVARRGSYEVGYPLKEYGSEISITNKDLAYMNPEEFQAHIDGVMTLGRNRLRHEILYRLFNNTNFTFKDDRLPDATVKPLANGDADLYPPIEGSDDQATENHYLESGYAASAISDTNNPIETLAEDLVHHGLNSQTDIPTMVLINSAQKQAITALTNFVPYVPPAIARGADSDQVLMPPVPAPGNRIIGYVSGSGWVGVWNWIPANYMVAVNLQAPAPMKMRVHPSGTGLSRGNIVLANQGAMYPNQYRDWEYDFGLGVGNRLAAAVMELGTGGTYTVPSAYS